MFFWLWMNFMAGFKIGILHPGQMGVSVAASAQKRGNSLYWVSQGRSEQTRQRAEAHNLIDAGTLEILCATCEVILSVCPPHAAEQVAEQVLSQGFKGLYLDANAISPQRAVRIGQHMDNAGVSFVDGGIIGGPAWEKGETWLYLAGMEAGRVASCFGDGALEIQVIGEQIGKASALKMCYAAYTKGTTALLCAILALSEELEVRQELAAQWARDWPELMEQAEGRARRATAKAWRFVGEMDEITATFEAAGLPGGFHAAAGEVYRRLASFKDREELPALEEVLAALVSSETRV
jgi:3-hydroxyisobutyrate dehydrogenase-like beta-hydroxyacid dehydrogenase